MHGGAELNKTQAPPLSRGCSECMHGREDGSQGGCEDSHALPGLVHLQRHQQCPGQEDLHGFPLPPHPQHVPLPHPVSFPGAHSGCAECGAGSLHQQAVLREEDSAPGCWQAARLFFFALEHSEGARLLCSYRYDTSLYRGVLILYWLGRQYSIQRINLLVLICSGI